MKLTWPRNMLQIIVNPVYPQVKLGQLVVANAAVAWIVLLMWPGETTVRATYAGMHAIGGDLTWANVFSVVAFLMYMRLEVWQTENRWTLAVDTAVAFVWTFVTMSLLVAMTPPPAAIAGEITICIIAIWLWIHTTLKHEVRAAIKQEVAREPD